PGPDRVHSNRPCWRCDDPSIAISTPRRLTPEGRDHIVSEQILSSCSSPQGAQNMVRAPLRGAAFAQAGWRDYPPSQPPSLSEALTAGVDAEVVLGPPARAGPRFGGRPSPRRP